MAYPDISGIRQKLEEAARRTRSYFKLAFLTEAIKVCDSVAGDGPTVDIQTQAKLRFIEKVLNG